jgi:hypothetical protein
MRTHSGESSRPPDLKFPALALGRCGCRAAPPPAPAHVPHRSRGDVSMRDANPGARTASVMNDRILGHLAQRFAVSEENLATEALTWLLRRSAAARAALAGLVRAVGTDVVPLENTMRPGDLRVLGDQAAWAYSLIRPLRTGLRRICCLSTSVTIAQGASRSSAGTRCAMPWWGLAVL